MGFETWDDLKTAKREDRVLAAPYFKQSVSSAGNLETSLWATVGNIQGAQPVGATTYTSTAGGIVFPDTGSTTKHILHTSFRFTQNPAWVMVYDRLTAFGGVAATGVGAKASVTPALPRYTTGERVRAVVEVQGQSLTATRTITLTYTNELGVGSRTTTQMLLPTSAGSGLTGLLFFPGLQAGDLGVRSVEAVNVVAETGGGTSTVNVVLYRQLIAVPGPPATGGAVGEQKWVSGVDWFAQFSACPQVLDGATLNFFVRTGPGNFAGAGEISGAVEVVLG